MAELQNAKIIRVGNSFGILIPKALLDCKILDPTRTVHVTLDQKNGPGGICHGTSFLNRPGIFGDGPLDPLDSRAEAL